MKILEKSIFFILIFVYNISLQAGIEDYFKLPTDKPTIQTIKNVDYIYMINLDRRPEKYLDSMKQLKSYNIVPYRFSAVNGWELPLASLSKLGVTFEKGMKTDIMGTYYPEALNGTPQHELIQTVGRNYFSHCMSRGAIGIVLSHLSVLQDAYDSGYETIWVMEDDIAVIRNPHMLSDLIDTLDQKVGKQSWDILFTDPDTKNQRGEYVPCLSYARRPNFSPWNPSRFSKRHKIDSELKKIGARYGAYSMIVRRSGMKKILDFIKQHHIFLPYDMEFYLPNDIEMYSVVNDVVSTCPNALSDNGAPRYEENGKQ